jgi:hypothetical protein
MLLVVTILIAIPAFSQDIGEDSITTPFRKGRWLTGLSGSISSGSTKLDTASQRAFTNQYSFDFSTGKFFKDQWLLGGIFKMQRDNSRQFVDLESETLLVAPLLSYYISNNKQGSIFFLIAPGYARFREKTVVLVGGAPSEEVLKGGGFGLFVQFGYSYVLHDRIVFDLGLGLNSAWANAERGIEPGRAGNKVNIHTGNLLFSFGFNVILDEFFF